MLRQPLLTGFAWLMLDLMVPALALLALDDRTWRDVAIWAKPVKFMASTALFSATTAWLVGLLPEPMRRTRAVRAVACTVVLTSSFEVGYISLQAALGESSHHNVCDPLHAALFGLMAAAAVMLTATQAMLARHAVWPHRIKIERQVSLGLTGGYGSMSRNVWPSLRPPQAANSGARRLARPSVRHGAQS